MDSIQVTQQHAPGRLVHHQLMNNKKETPLLLGVALEIHSPEQWPMRDVQAAQVMSTPFANEIRVQTRIFRQRLYYTTLRDHRCRQWRLSGLPHATSKGKAQAQGIMTAIERFDNQRQI